MTSSVCTPFPTSLDKTEHFFRSLAATLFHDTFVPLDCYVDLLYDSSAQHVEKSDFGWKQLVAFTRHKF